MSESSRPSALTNIKETESSPIHSDGLSTIEREISGKTGTASRIRRIHMSSGQCLKRTQISEGAKALTNPYDLSKSSQDPNRYLYPRNTCIGSDNSQLWKSITQSCQNTNSHQSPSTKGFVSARQIHERSTSLNKSSSAKSEPSCSDSVSTVYDNADVNNTCSQSDKLSLVFSQSSQTRTRQTKSGSSRKSRTLTPANALGSQSIFSFFSKGQGDIKSSRTDSNGTCTEGSLSQDINRSRSQQSVSETHGYSHVKGSKFVRSRPLTSVNSIQNFFAIKKEHVCLSDNKFSSEIIDLTDDANLNIVNDTVHTSDLINKNAKQLSTNSKRNGKYIKKGTRTRKSNTTNWNKNKATVGMFTQKRYHSGEKCDGEPDVKQILRTEGSDSITCPDTSIGSTSAEKYGLLGIAETVRVSKPAIEERVNGSQCLPAEVLENIFCYLPILDLCLNTNRVCSAWNQVISNPKFMLWKKRYHRLKKDVAGTREAVQKLISQHKMTGTPLIGLIRFMSSFKRVPEKMVEYLQHTSKHALADALIKERVPDCVIDGVPSSWSIIAALVIVSTSVADIRDIFHKLLYKDCPLTAADLLEGMYCIATFLLAFKLKCKSQIWTSMHYRLYYALYLFENSATISYAQLSSALKGHSGQQCISKYSNQESSVQMTHEQMRICNYNVNPGDIIKIVAFAGTGKTTTLVKYTQLHPEMKFLLVVYNKSVCEHAKKQFPSNVTIKTGHGLAFGAVGRRYAAADKLHRYNLKVYELTQILEPKKRENLFIRAKFVLDTLNNYLVSADDDITTAHVPTEKLEDNGNNIPIEHASRMLYAEDARYVWKRMTSMSDRMVRITHDGYLKLYQLSRPRLYNYDCILIDEAQDLTPAVEHIMLSQSQAKILVGDPYQQIYAFRGAVNAMQRIDSTQIFYLTQSFRFGPDIARVASCCLELLKNEQQKTLVGTSSPGCITGKQVGQLTILSRCNYTVFNQAVTKCCYSKTDYKVAFVGGTDAFGFNMLLDIYGLLAVDDNRKDKREIKNSFIRSFRTLAALEKYATTTNDSELLGKIKIVRTHHHNLPQCINKILKKCTSDEARADIIFSTAHKSKGLEFDTVLVTDDFTSSQTPNPFQRLVPADEDNLLYVAVTRAKKALILSPTLHSIMRLAGEYLSYPVLSSVLQKTTKQLTCLHSKDVFEPCSLTLEKHTIKLSDNREITGGIYSPETIYKHKPTWRELLGREPKRDHADGNNDSDDSMDADFSDDLSFLLAFF